MKTLHSEVTIADFCKGLAEGEYLVNRDYQRSDKVWPTPAKSFLIETILLEFPVPKLSIHQRLDLKTRTVRKEIVDGQQRTKAIQEFYSNRLRLSRTLKPDFAGRTFNELTDEHQSTFLNYSLSFDLFAGASVEQVREVFRRMNSFTIPLNNEESRHAIYQGPFKWFINELGTTYSEPFAEVGIFTEKQLNRMQDAKLLTEIAHAMVNGIATTSKSSLDGIYRRFDQDFIEEEMLKDALTKALDSSLFGSDIQGTALAKPLNFYALVLAHVQNAGQVKPEPDVDPLAVGSFAAGDSAYNLSLLADALSEGDDSRVADDLRPFRAAAKDRTNVAEQRRTRFKYFLAAIES